MEVVERASAAVLATDRSDIWSRVFSALYDPFLWAGERAGLGALRGDLLGQAEGRTVELGSGTGLNLRYFPGALDELILTEPEAAMRKRLVRRLDRSRCPARVLDASAERLPLEDDSVDTVVSTFALCTIDAPELALREVARVLCPGGQLLFLEHVRSESPRLAHWQDRLASPWRRFAQGCRCNRATVELIRASGLTLPEVHTASWRAMPPIVRPLMVGVATKGARRPR